MKKLIQILFPVRKPSVSSPFGMRKHPITKVWKKHEGVDFRSEFGRDGDDIIVSHDGIVKISKWQGNIINTKKGWGQYIIVESLDKSFCTVYAHLSKRYVQVGQKVRAGDKIALMGNTGASAGTHLHFGLFNCEYKKFFTKNSDKTYKYAIDPKDYFVDKIEKAEEKGGLNMELYKYCGYTLRKGRKGNDVKIWQKAMKELGFYKGSIDGSIGKLGHQAIIDFQEARKLSIDGMFGRGSAKELNKALIEFRDKNKEYQNPSSGDNSNLPNFIISKGTKGTSVGKIQYFLKKLGYEIIADNSFGNGTEKVIKQFQENNKISITGRFDSTTRKKMLEEPRCQYQEYKYDKQTTVIKMRIEDFHTVLIDVPKRKTLPSIMKSLKWKPKVLLNGGLFNMTSAGEDLNKMIVTYKKAGSIYFSKKGMKMSHGDVLSFGEPDSSTKSFLGGSPYIVENSKFTTDYYETLKSSYTDRRHPRSGVGIDDEYIYVVLVRGRASWLGYYGVTLKEYANIFIKLGCKYAQNNDGGGSVGAIDSKLRWIFKSYRAIGNAIAFYRRG